MPCRDDKTNGGGCGIPPAFGPGQDITRTESDIAIRVLDPIS